MVLASALEPLRAIQHLLPDENIQWRIASFDGEVVQSSSKIMLYPDCALESIPSSDILFVIAGYGVRTHSTSVIAHGLARAVTKSAAIGGLDVGAWPLAYAQLLSGYRATIHWQELAAFEEEFHSLRAEAARFVIDRNRITAGGATAVMDLMLHLIRGTFGNAAAFDVSNLFVYDADLTQRNNRGARAHGLSIRAPQLQNALKYMRETAGDPVPIKSIALHAAVSARTLERMFQKELRISPSKYYLMVRLNLARSLAEETFLSVSEISVRTGFSSTATLGRAFKEQFSISIRTLRQSRTV